MAIVLRGVSLYSSEDGLPNVCIRHSMDKNKQYCCVYQSQLITKFSAS